MQIKDSLTEYGARKMAREIEEFWAIRKVKIHIWIEAFSCRNKVLWCVRSNLHLSAKAASGI